MNHLPRSFLPSCTYMPPHFATPRPLHPPSSRARSSPIRSNSLFTPPRPTSPHNLAARSMPCAAGASDAGAEVYANGLAIDGAVPVSAFLTYLGTVPFFSMQSLRCLEDEASESPTRYQPTGIPQVMKGLLERLPHPQQRFPAALTWFVHCLMFLKLSSSQHV